MKFLERDIKFGKLKYKGTRVFFDDRKVDSQYEEGFWHVIERGKNIRTLDLKRAKRLPWIKPLIDFSDDPRLLKWIENNTNKKGRSEEVTYINYEEESYLVVLKYKHRGYFLATAYYVVGYNKQWYREKSEKDK